MRANQNPNPALLALTPKNMEIKVSFPGGKRVDAAFGEHVVRTDQPVSGGGENSAPAPFDLFLASLATCAGIYVLGFCQARSIPTEGFAITQRDQIDPETHLPTAIVLEITFPKDFPEKYKPAVIRAAEGCKVKKSIVATPRLEVREA